MFDFEYEVRIANRLGADDCWEYYNDRIEVREETIAELETKKPTKTIRAKIKKLRNEINMFEDFKHML